VDTMAGAFGLGVGEMMSQVEGLVGDGRIKGRVDLIDNVSDISSLITIRESRGRRESGE
jgi:hypothetical protein